MRNSWEVPCEHSLVGKHISWGTTHYADAFQAGKNCPGPSTTRYSGRVVRAYKEGHNGPVVLIVRSDAAGKKLHVYPHQHTFGVLRDPRAE